VFRSLGRLSMPTRNDVVSQARKWVGYTEGPRNNETVFGKRTGYQFQPWCGSFTDCVLIDAGFSVTKSGSGNTEPSSVYTPSGVNSYKRLNRWMHNNGPCEPGDIVYFDFENNGVVDHVGIVTGSRGIYVDTIEGNTSMTNQANGGQVMVRSRHRYHIAGFGRPVYNNNSNLPSNKEFDVKEADMYIAVDGVGFFAQFGAVTIPLPGIDLVGFAKLVEPGKSVGFMTIPKSAAQDFVARAMKQTARATS